jgi:plastocyanin
MNGRLKLVLAATAAVGIGAAGVVSTAGAAVKPKKNEILIVGGTKVKPGKFLKNDLRFKRPNTNVRSGATVTLRDKGEQGEPHTITFIEKRFLPKQFESGLEPQLMEAHGVPADNPEGDPTIPVVDNGAPLAAGATLQVDTMFSKTVAGDSAFLFPGFKKFTFQVTADRRSKLFYYCALHPWMQGKISVR